VVAPAAKSERERDRLLKTCRVSQSFAATRNAGRVVNTENYLITERRGFTTEDILWALGIWSVTISLSPVVIFYMLMVA
jgi:hypothetical protein